MLTPEQRDAVQALVDSQVEAYRGWILQYPSIYLKVPLAGLLLAFADILTPIVRHGALPGHTTDAIDEFLQRLRAELISREL
jgi:hypothetical protein